MLAFCNKKSEEQLIIILLNQDKQMYQFKTKTKRKGIYLYFYFLNIPFNVKTHVLENDLLPSNFFVCTSSAAP